jgi:hypothetical protein
MATPLARRVHNPTLHWRFLASLHFGAENC